MSTQALTIRIGADANGAISVISQTTSAVNNLGNAGTRANSGVASLTGGVQNLGRWSGQTTSAMASLTGGVNGLSRATLDAINGTTRLNQQLAENTRVTNAAAGSMNSLKSVIAGLGIAKIVSDILKINMEMQTLRSSLETVTGSANNARIAFEGVQKFAANTPYSVKEITDAYITLKARGLAPTEAALTSFGNTASAMNKTLDQTIQMVADAATGQFDRLAEFGLNAEKSGDKIKFTFKGIETSVEDSSSKITEYLIKLGNVDFASGMQNKAKTVEGVISSLGDSWDAFRDHIINDAAEGAIALWITNATNALSRFDAWLNGAFTKSGKLAELRMQQAASLEKISASEKNGFGGRVADAVGEALWGYSVENERKKLASIGKQMEEVKKGIAADENTKLELEKATTVQKTKESALEFEKKYADDHRKLVIKEQEDLKEQTKLLQRELTTQEKLMIHNTVFASEIRASESASKKAAHKEETDAMRAAKKEQQEYQHLIESTPYGEYNAQVDKLTAGLKRGGEAFRATYSTGIEEANKKLLDGTQYVKDHIEAQKEYKKLIEETPFGKYFADMEKFNSALKNGGIDKNTFDDLARKAADTFEKTAVDHSKIKDNKAYDNEVEGLRKVQREIEMNSEEMYKFDLIQRKAADGSKEFSDKQIENLIKIRNEVQIVKFVDDLGLSSKKIGESFGTMFKDIALNGKSVTQALGDMFTSMMNRITSTILDFTAQGLVQKMFSGFSGEAGGLFSGLGGTVTALVGAVALGTYMGLQKHGSGIAPTISQTSKYPNGVPADASLMLKTDAAISDMVFLQTSKFADTYNKSLRDVLTSSFSLVRKNAESLGNFLNSTLNTYFPDFMQGLGELKTGIGETFNGLVAGGKELIAKGTDAIGVTTDAVQSLAEEKLNAVFDKVGGVASKSMEKLLGTVAVIVSVGTEVYQLVTSWDSLKGVGNKLLAVTDSIGAIATTVAITFSNPIAAAVAGVATAISQVGALIKDGFTAQNIARLAGGMIGAAIGTMILPGFGTLIGYVLGDTFGKLIGSLFQKQQKMYLGMDSLIAAKPYDNASLTSPKDISRNEGLAYTADTKGREIIFGTTMGGVLFGQTQGIDQPLNQDQKDYAQSVAKTVNGIGMLLNSLDQAIYGVTDKTNLLFRTNLHFEEKLDAKNFDSVKVMNSFFDDFLKRLETTGTESAKKVTDWIRVFTDAFSQEYKMAVIVALTQSNTGKDPLLFKLAKKPVEYMNYVDTQVKKLVNTGKTQEQIITDVSDTMAKTGGALDMTLAVLNDMGIAAKDDYGYLIGMLNAMDSLGMTMFESANMVMVLGKAVKDSLKDAANLTGDALKNVMRDKMKVLSDDWNQFVTTAKLTGSQPAMAFQSSLNLMQVSKELGLSDAEKLSVFGSIINEAAKVSANKDNAYKPVDDANAALVKAQQSKSGIEQAQTAYDDALKKYNKDFETYLLKSGAEIVNNMMFMQSIYLATNKKITDSMTASDFINSTNSFVDALGGIDKAMQITDKNMTLALGEKGAAKWKLDVATNALATALNKVGKTAETVIAAYLNDPLDAELAKTVSLLGQTKDAQKAYNQSLNQSLSDANKFADNFNHAIKSWIQNLRATQLGSPESQFNAAKDNFAAQMKIINGGLATSAEEKQAALSGITGVADTYIAAIKSNYASTKEGQELIAQVVEQVSGLTTNIDVQQLQLGVLQQIRDGVHAIPTGISDTQKTFFESLATKIDTAQKTYISAPTSTNDLAANTLAKEWTMAVDYATKGSGFLDAFIKSFDGKTGLDAAVNLIFSDKYLNPVQAQTAIDNVLSRVISLVNIEVVPHFLTTVAQREIDQQIALLNPPSIYLSVDTTSAVSVIKSVTDTATNAIRAINNLDALGSLTAISPSIYNASEMLQTVTPQLMQSSPFAVEPKIGGGIPADSSILKRLSSIDTARNSNSGNSSSDTKETVEELKKQTAELAELVRQTTALLKLQMAANQELVDKMNSMDESLKTTAKKTRLQAVK